jgi:hypothetical protein
MAEQRYQTDREMEGLLMTNNLIDQVREAQRLMDTGQTLARLRGRNDLERLTFDMARHILAQEERLKALEDAVGKSYRESDRVTAENIQLEKRLKAADELAEAARKVRAISNRAFAAGTEEREGGSGRRQGKFIDEYEALISAIEEALATYRATGGKKQ